VPHPSRRTNSSIVLGFQKKTAVFMDAGAVFFAARDMHEGQQLAYPALMDLLTKKGFPLPDRSVTRDEHLWVMWSSSVAQNPGQVRFFHYAERELGWRVRRFHPTEGYMVDPVSVGLTGETRAVNRLLRFDASIAFAIGRVAEDHRIAVVTDSFAVAEPLLRAARLRGEGNKLIGGGNTNMIGEGSTNLIVFFSRLLDPRWQRLLRDEAERVPIDLLDLDEHEEQLFGAQKPRETTGWNDDFLIK